MSISTVELEKANYAANQILEELQLDAYIYELEPRDNVWELTVECACSVDGGWESVVLQVPKQMLLDSGYDNKAKQRLFEYWKKILADCKLRQG